MLSPEAGSSTPSFRRYSSLSSSPAAPPSLSPSAPKSSLVHPATYTVPQALSTSCTTASTSTPRLNRRSELSELDRLDPSPTNQVSRKQSFAISSQPMVPMSPPNLPPRRQTLKALVDELNGESLTSNQHRRRDDGQNQEKLEADLTPKNSRGAHQPQLTNLGSSCTAREISRIPADDDELRYAIAHNQKSNTPFTNPSYQDHFPHIPSLTASSRQTHPKRGELLLFDTSDVPLNARQAYRKRLQDLNEPYLPSHTGATHPLPFRVYNSFYQALTTAAASIVSPTRPHPPEPLDPDIPLHAISALIATLGNIAGVSSPAAAALGPVWSYADGSKHGRRMAIYGRSEARVLNESDEAYQISSTSASSEHEEAKAVSDQRVEKGTQKLMRSEGGYLRTNDVETTAGSECYAGWVGSKRGERTQQEVFMCIHYSTVSVSSSKSSLSVKHGTYLLTLWYRSLVLSCR